MNTAIMGNWFGAKNRGNAHFTRPPIIQVTLRDHDE